MFFELVLVEEGIGLEEIHKYWSYEEGSIDCCYISLFEAYTVFDGHAAISSLLRGMNSLHLQLSRQ